MQIEAVRLLDSLKEAVQATFTAMLGSVAALAGPAPEDASELDGIDVEARLAFEGSPSGSVVLWCRAAGAAGLARELLTPGESGAVDLEQVQAALGECASLLAGTLEEQVVRGGGECTLLTSTPEARVRVEPSAACGRLVYRLSQGSVAVEIWFSEECLG